MGRNADRPVTDSLAFFRKATRGHDKVESVTAKTDQIYYVSRTTGDTVTVYVTDLYTVGVTDYVNIRDRDAEVNCIVTISNWNGYTDEAKQYARKQRVGLFTFQEFMGALNVPDFWSYPKSTGKKKFGTKRSAADI